MIHGCALHSHIFNSCIDKLQKRTIEKLDAYADGINEFVRLNNLPLEYSVLGINFEPWTIIDTLSIMKMTMFHMTYDWSIEVMSEYLFKFIQNKEVVHQLLPFHDKDTWVFNTTIMDDHEIEETIHQYFNNNFELKEDFEVKKNSQKITKENFKRITSDKRMKHQGTSSIWTVHGNYTSSGKPIFAINYHFDLGIPSTMHLSELYFTERREDNTTQEFMVSGGCIPGTPIYMTGKNKHLSWGPTSVETPISKIYKEKVNQTHYLRKDGWVPFDIKNETIPIKDEIEDVSIQTKVCILKLNT